MTTALTPGAGQPCAADPLPALSPSNLAVSGLGFALMHDRRTAAGHTSLLPRRQCAMEDACAGMFDLVRGCWLDGGGAVYTQWESGDRHSLG